MSHVFALTGGIGSGKSTVARIWRERGLPVVDADELARRVVDPGSTGLRELVEHFGEEVLHEDGGLHRAKLAERVFGDEAARARLNRLLHPRIRDEAERRFAALRDAGEPLVCYEIPLLFEIGQADKFRPVVVVHAPLELRVERARLRDGTDSAAIRRRVEAQIPLEQKVERADYVIDNGEDEDATRARSLEVLAALRQRFG